MGGKKTAGKCQSQCTLHVILYCRLTHLIRHLLLQEIKTVDITFQRRNLMKKYCTVLYRLGLKQGSVLNLVLKSRQRSV